MLIPHLLQVPAMKIHGKGLSNTKIMLIAFSFILTLQLPDQICNSPYCQSYNSYNVRSENLVLNQLIIPILIFFFILITYLGDIVLIL